MAAKKSPPRRNTDVIRCEKCGEEYSVTYKRCPFCDERPGRSYPAVGGRRARGGGPNPLQVGGLILTLVLIIAAAAIVFKYVSPFLFAGQTPGSSISSHQSSAPSDGSGSGSQVQVTVNSLTLSRTEVSLRAGEPYQILATTDPEDVEVTWSSSDPSIATVDEYGNVTNVYTGSDVATVTITAAAGDQTAQCVVSCTGDGTAADHEDPNTATDPDDGQDNNNNSSNTGNNTSSGGAVLAPNTEALITGATGGLNIRSGPGTNYETKASTNNGATVVVLEDAGNGWAKIKYSTGGGNYEEGYVMYTYLQAK